MATPRYLLIHGLHVAQLALTLLDFGLQSGCLTARLFGLLLTDLQCALSLLRILSKRDVAAAVTDSKLAASPVSPVRRSLGWSPARFPASPSPRLAHHTWLPAPRRSTRGWPWSARSPLSAHGTDGLAPRTSSANPLPECEPVRSRV